MNDLPIYEDPNVAPQTSNARTVATGDMGKYLRKIKDSRRPDQVHLKVTLGAAIGEVGLEIMMPREWLDRGDGTFGLHLESELRRLIARWPQ